MPCIEVHVGDVSNLNLTFNIYKPAQMQQTHEKLIAKKICSVPSSSFAENPFDPRLGGPFLCSHPFCFSSRARSSIHV
jgi:hypothetical protein